MIETKTVEPLLTEAPTQTATPETVPGEESAPMETTLPEADVEATPEMEPAQQASAAPTQEATPPGEEPTAEPSEAPNPEATEVPTATPEATAATLPDETTAPTEEQTQPEPMSLLSSAVEAFYWYNGDGTLVKSNVNGVLTYYAGRHYHKVVDGEDQTIRKFYTAGSAQIAMRNNGVLTWVLSDHLGSASVTANEDGSFLSEQRYTAFGEVRFASGQTETPYQYTGQLSQMEAIGLYYYVARWYDPVTAHFAQADTIVPNQHDAQGWDRFAYVNNNAINMVDPSGHMRAESEACYRKGCGYTWFTDMKMLSYLKENEVTAGDVNTKFGSPNTVIPSSITIPTDPSEYLSFIRSVDERTQRPFGTHAGIDKGTVEGNKVYAIAPGTVTAILPISQTSAPGYVMIIRHAIMGADYYAVYFHLQVDLDTSEMITDRKAGDIVEAGDEVAHVGTTGSANTPHLHFEIRRDKGVWNGGKSLNNPRGYWLSDPSQLDTTWLDISPAFGGYGPQYPDLWKRYDDK